MPSAADRVLLLHGPALTPGRWLQSSLRGLRIGRRNRLPVADLLELVAQGRKRSAEGIGALRVLVREIVLLVLEIGEADVVLSVERVRIALQRLLKTLDRFRVLMLAMQVDAERRVGAGRIRIDRDRTPECFVYPGAAR